MKTFKHLLIFCCLLLNMLSGWAQSGTCGENLTWTLDSSTGTLTISGIGKMTDYSNSSSAPWMYYNGQIKYIEIKAGVTSIGDYAFIWCSYLTSITIPNSVMSVGDYAFFRCLMLTSIAIPNNLTSIGDEAFCDCMNLTSITIPNSVLSIGKYAFSNCTGLTSIEVENENPLYMSENGVFYNKEKTILICCPAGKTGNYTIPNCVTSIESYAFSGCSSLTSITIPNSVLSIGGYAFSACSSLTSITIPNSVLGIGGYAFSYCSSLTSITIPDGIMGIESGTFSNCGGLTSITIPNSVTSIGGNAFINCRGLTSITCHALEPPTLGFAVFSGVNTNACTLYVPVCTLDMYEADPGWNNFNIVENGIPATFIWKGKNPDWNKEENWDPEIIPGCIDIVIIPSEVDFFPDLTLLEESSGPVSVKEIHFKPGAQLGGQHLLDENTKAFVSYDFTDANEKRGHWLMLSIPLAQVYPADFAFGGYPLTWMRKFATEGDEGSVARGKWVPVQGSANAFTFGDGFVLQLDEDDQEVNGKGLAKLEGILELPYFQYLEDASSPEYDFYKDVNFAQDYFIDPTPKSWFYNYKKNEQGVYVRDEDPETTTPPYSVDRDVVKAHQLLREAYTKSIIIGDGDFFLIGNPYMAALDFEKFSEDFINESIIKPVFHIWTNNKYESYSSLITEPLIAPLQGFIVEKNDELQPGNAFIRFDGSMTEANTNVILRSSASAGNKLEIVACNPVTSTRAYIANREDGQKEFGKRDARKIIHVITDVPEIYTLKPYKGKSTGAAINVINSDDLLIPLGLATSYAGAITFSFTGMDTYDAQLSLFDKETDEWIELTGMASYEYVINYIPMKKANGDISACEDRFFIRISKASTGLTETIVEKVNVFDANGFIQVISGASNPVKEVSVYNLQGALMYKANALNTISHTIKRNWHSGVYIVKVISEKDTDTVKLIIR